jgi:hypothetical protein
VQIARSIAWETRFDSSQGTPFSKTNLLMEVANEIRDKRNEPLVRRESVKKFHGAIP